MPQHQQETRAVCVCVTGVYWINRVGHMSAMWDLHPYPADSSNPCGTHSPATLGALIVWHHHICGTGCSGWIVGLPVH